MGSPQNFNLELPRRCLQLIEELWPYAERTLQADRPDLGSLTTTFLISMSMPIINLPVERIERNLAASEQGYADDRHIDEDAARAIGKVLGGQELLKAPFYIPGAWRFISCNKPPFFNIANPLPDDIASELSSVRAADCAGKMPTSQWCSILRNAMAHGGIAYLNADGQSTYGEAVDMYVFVSGKYDNDSYKLVGLNLLRIREADYRAFPRKWVDWLSAVVSP
jgi:hypothetical protein